MPPIFGSSAQRASGSAMGMSVSFRRRLFHGYKDLKDARDAKEGQNLNPRVATRGLGPRHAVNAAAANNRATDQGSSDHRVQPNCMTTMTLTTFASASGIKTFQAKPINWSNRNRGIVQRISK